MALKNISRIVLPVAAFCIAVISACKHEPVKPASSADGDFPEPVAKIFISKCATSGCHNAATHAGGIRLDNWDRLFDGGDNGAVVVPFSPKYSSLLYFINTDTTLGPVAEPRMPQSQPGQDTQPLSKDEYMTIRSWIEQGCPDKNGIIPFADNADSRQKIYMTMQGCNQLGVIDAERKVIMRYIPLGVADGQSPHCVRVSPDGRYAYVSYTIGGTHLDRINTTTDKLDWSIPIGAGSWNIFQISPDNNKVALSDWQGNGRVVFHNLTDGSMYGNWEGYVYPHGIACNPTFDTLFVSAQYGNAVYSLDQFGFYKEMYSLDGNPPSASANVGTQSRNPHELMMLPGNDRYAVTCQGTNEIRVMDAHSNKVVDSLPVGYYPQEMAISHKYPYLFVSCELEPNPEFSTASVKFRGKIYVINYNTMEIVKVIGGRFSEIHGVTVDDKNGVFYFASRNIQTDGPPPHHTSDCGGKNGYYNVYSLSTLAEATTKRYEVLSDPYSVDTRFK